MRVHRLIHITVNPPFFVGPLAPGFRVPPGDRKALSTDEFIYNLLFAENKVDTPALGFVDVRDVAIALVKGQKTPGKHRIVFRGEWFAFEEAIEYIASIRPELKGRLATASPTTQKNSIVDNSKAALVLGLTPRPWKESVRDGVDDLLKLEKSWIAQGIEVKGSGGTY
jgi:nucleoside-diphosphate-sugar epimerase